MNYLVYYHKTGQGNAVQCMRVSGHATMTPQDAANSVKEQHEFPVVILEVKIWDRSVS